MNKFLAFLISVPLAFDVLDASAQPDPNVHSGFKSLHVNKAVDRADCTGLSLTAGVTYNLTYWLKTAQGAPIGVTFCTWVQGVYPVQQVIYDNCVTSGGYQSSTAFDTNWHQYSATIVPSITATDFAFGIDCRSATTDFYIDDVSLVAATGSSNLVADPGFETEFQSNFNNDGNDWTTANWVDLRWMSEYAWQVHQYGNPNGPKALYIETSSTLVAPLAPMVVAATLHATGTGVTVVYSEAITAASATNVSNYALNNGGVITSATISGDGMSVALTTSPLSSAETNILTINGVVEATGVSTIASNTQVIVTSTSVQVAAYNGAPTIMVNHTPLTAPGYSNYRPVFTYLTNFARAGTLLYDFPGTASAWDGGSIPPTWTASNTWDYSLFDQYFSTVLAANSNALVIPRIYIGTPPWWLTAHPSEWEITQNGTAYYAVQGVRPSLGPFPSLASTVWRQDMGDAIDRLIDHIEAKGWMSHVVGFKISGLETEEWYYWSSGGDGELSGYSANTAAAFQAWLKTRYANNVAALQASWNSSSVTFDTAPVPTPAMRTNNTGIRTFRNATTEQNVIDWYQFYDQLVPQTMDYFAGRIKTKTSGTKIVGGFYGYLQEFMGNPEFGHDALSTYYASTNLDFIYLTASYGDLSEPAANPTTGVAGNYQRGAGGSDYPRGPDTSARLHGKLWYEDNDMATALNPATMTADGLAANNLASSLIEGGYSSSLQQNAWMMDRFAGFVAGSGMYEDLLDLYGGDFNTNSLMAEAAALNQFATRTALHDRSSTSQILVVSDELSCSYVAYSTWDNPLLDSALYFPPSQLVKVGAPHDNVLLDDLAIIDPTPYRMIVFLNCYNMTDSQRQAVSRFKTGGKMLVFCYAPGYFNGTNSSNSNMLSLTGINIQAATSESLVAQTTQLYSNTSSAVLPLVTSLYQSGYTNFGPAGATAKRFTVVDPTAYSLGIQPHSSNVTMAYKDQGNWKSVYTLTAALPDGIWRALASNAGVHIYSSFTNDTLYANKSYVCLHANGPGARTVTWPQNGTIYNAMTENVLAAGTNQIGQTLQNGETVLLRFSADQPTLYLTGSGAQVSIAYTGTLQSADAATGPWTEVTNAASPYEIPLSGAATQFYRARQ